MRLIDADELLNEFDKLDLDYGATGGVAECIAITEQAPTIDAVKVIRCENCRYWNSETRGCKRNPSVEAWKKDDFCKYGKRWSNAIDRCRCISADV